MADQQLKYFRTSSHKKLSKVDIVQKDKARRDHEFMQQCPHADELKYQLQKHDSISNRG